ncbi:MAG: hypothetical protein ABI779_18170 [Acidobacteriota bacterium]
MNDLQEIEHHIRTALKRSHVKRKVVEERMRRITHAATLLLDPRLSLVRVQLTISVADLYAALFMVVVADTFQDGEHPGIAGDFFRFTREECDLLHRTFALLHERYFGFAPLPVEDEA